MSDLMIKGAALMRILKDVSLTGGQKAFIAVCINKAVCINTASSESGGVPYADSGAASFDYFTVLYALDCIRVARVKMNDFGQTLADECVAILSQSWD